MTTMNAIGVQHIRPGNTTFASIQGGASGTEYVPIIGRFPGPNKTETLAVLPIDTPAAACDNRPRARALTRTRSMRRTLPAAVLAVLIAAIAPAQVPKAQKAAAKSAPKATPEQQRATADIHQFFRRVTQRLADADLADVKTFADWQAKRPRLREQMLEMLGLLAMPEPAGPKASVAGRL